MDFCGRIMWHDSVMRSLLFLHQPSVWTIGGEKTKMQCKANWCPQMQLLHIMMMIFRILIIFESSAGGRRRYQITHHGMFLLVQPKHDSEVSSHHHLFQQCCYESVNHSNLIINMVAPSTNLIFNLKLLLAF